MGYQARTYRLVFEDPTLEGLEVRCRGAAIHDVVTFTAATSMGAQLLEPAGRETLDGLFAMLAGRIIDWNLEDEHGQPIPVNEATLRAQDWSLVLGIGRAWMNATAGVSRPLEQPSPDGPPSVEASIPMEPPSSSPPS